MGKSIANGYQGVSVASFESRKAGEMKKNISRLGGKAFSAPSVRQISLSEHPQVFSFAEKLFQGEVSIVIFMTGVGAKMMIDALLTRYKKGEVIRALRPLTIVSRGPKPVPVLKSFGISISLIIPEPSTSREIVETLDLSSKSVTLRDRLVVIQESGASNEYLESSLRERGARVLKVPIYKWALPQDKRPLSDVLQKMIRGDVDISFFTNANQVRHVFKIAEENGIEKSLREAFKKIVVASVGPRTTEAITQCGLGVDFESSRPTMEALVKETAQQVQFLIQKKKGGKRVQTVVPRSQVVDSSYSRQESSFLKACRLEKTPYTPIWIMRQAGRYLREYRDIRNKVSFMEMCRNKEIVAEVTVMAVEKIKADAAILFSDILLIVEPMGLDLKYESGDGPHITGQVATSQDIDRLKEIEPGESLGYVFDAVQLTRSSLRENIPLIGFSGAPFTLASYMIEGGGSKSFANTKRLMYSDPIAWHALMEKISRGLIKYLNGQVSAGVDALQIFDSWVGCLGPRDYREFVLPHTKAVIEGIQKNVPVIHFGTGTAPFLKEMRQAGGDVIGVDFRIDLDEAWKVIGFDRGIQGNLDPVVLFSNRQVIRQRVKEILAHAHNRPGHIFNLGHGILPQTPVDNVLALIDYVHDLSS